MFKHVLTPAAPIVEVLAAIAAIRKEVPSITDLKIETNGSMYQVIGYLPHPPQEKRNVY